MAAAAIKIAAAAAAAGHASSLVFSTIEMVMPPPPSPPLALVLFLAVVATLAFPVADFFLAFDVFAPHSCQHTHFAHFHLTLYHWLIVDGTVQLLSSVPFFIVLLSAKNGRCRLVHFFFQTVIEPLQHVFIFVWTIVGCVLFWHFLLPTGACAVSLDAFMWIRLIGGLVSVVHHRAQKQ